MSKQEHVVVVGSGISGIVSSYLLDKKYKVTLIESNKRLGGHTHTVKVNEDPLTTLSIDTGFIVFNLINYPLFVNFLSQLKVPFENSDMSFGFYHVEKRFWYSSDFPSGIFSIKKNLFSPCFWQFLFQINDFNKRVLNDLETELLGTLSLGDYLDQLPFSSLLKEAYVLPMGAAIWSCPISELLKFPAQSFFSFWKNHTLLTLRNRPGWKTISNGSQTYINAFLKQFKGSLVVGNGVQTIKRNDQQCVIVLQNGNTIMADKVVLATHADQALSLLVDPSPMEQAVLGSWRYSNNIVYLHTDARVMPPKRNSWASWLVQQSHASDERLTMSYYMNRLQPLNTNKDYFVTLNQNRLIAPEKLIKTIHYKHPIFDQKAIQSQSALKKINQGPIYFCGSYFGYGFHEDGVKSAVSVCQKLGVSL